MKQIESIKECGGYLNRYTHQSSILNCTMTFSVYLPPQAENEKVATLYFLSGLTCDDENAKIKAGAQRFAAQQGIAIVFPDTSPRGVGVADEPDQYDLGKGAGFYINSTQKPWSDHYQMFDYVTKELPRLIEANFPIIAGLKSVTGHSMGGHGALICALKKPNDFKSVSAFAPISHATESPWGKKIMAEYLGDDESLWAEYDATLLIKQGASVKDILIDQGLDDEFYLDKQLLPENFQAACEQAEQNLTLRFQEGYDHSYHFVSSFIEDHIAYHAKALKA